MQGFAARFEARFKARFKAGFEARSARRWRLLPNAWQNPSARY